MSEALERLLSELDERGYAFTCVTPETHRRLVARRGAGAAAEDLRDVFGWSLPFERALLAGPLLDALEEAGALEAVADGRLRSLVRVSELGGRLFLHSAFPTVESDAVFFGPDTYRFVRFLEAELAGCGPVRHLVDLGAGSGAGGISAAALVEPERTSLADINPAALALARANAAAAGVPVELVEGGLGEVAGPIDLIVANPPFIADPLGRDYRDGGGELGAGLSLQWAREGMARLEPGGMMLLYTGVAILGGEDRLIGALAEAADAAECMLRYQEIDPDIFGEELDQPAYSAAGAERIAAVGAVLRKSDG